MSRPHACCLLFVVELDCWKLLPDSHSACISISNPISRSHSRTSKSTGLIRASWLSITSRQPTARREVGDRPWSSAKVSSAPLCSMSNTGWRCHPGASKVRPFRVRKQFPCSVQQPVEQRLAGLSQRTGFTGLPPVTLNLETMIMTPLEQGSIGTNLGQQRR